MPKNIIADKDIFTLLKGGVKGYSHHVLQVKNVFAMNLDSLVYDANKHIPEYATHIKICRYFYDSGIYNAESSNIEGKITYRVKNYEYAFLNDSYKKIFSEENLKGGAAVYESKNIGFLSCWNNYISLLKSIGEINDESLKVITANLRTTNFKSVGYALTNVNDGHLVFIDESIKTQKIKTLYDLISTGFITMECNENGVYFSKDDANKLPYKFEKKTFDTLTDTEKVCTLFSIYMGKLHVDSLKGDDKEKRVAIVKKRSIEGIIKTVRQEFTPFLDRQEAKSNLVKMSDIIAYFSNPNNHQKIVFDLLIGSFLKRNLKCNSVVASYGISISLDVNSLKALNTIGINDVIHHFDINAPIRVDDLKRIYTLKATRFFKGVDMDNVTDTSPINYFFYLCLYSNIVYEEQDDCASRPSVNNIVIDLVITDINSYFRSKDNHLQRKQKFYNNFDGDWKQLVAYRNRIVDKNKSLDVDLLNIVLENSATKQAVFNTFFTY